MKRVVELLVRRCYQYLAAEMEKNENDIYLWKEFYKFDELIHTIAG